MRVPACSLPVTALAEQVAGSPGTELVVLTILAAFGTVLAGIGILAVVAYTTERRRRELGIRRALGAAGSAIVATVIGRAATPIATGIGLGLAVAFGLGHALNAYLFGIEPVDPTMLAATAALFTVLALLACAIPARRAWKVDAVTTLRSE